MGPFQKFIHHEADNGTLYGLDRSGRGSLYTSAQGQRVVIMGCVGGSIGLLSTPYPSYLLWDPVLVTEGPVNVV